MRTKVLSILFVLFVSFFAGVAARAATVIDDPAQLVAETNTQSIAMELGDNLTQRIDGLDSIVDKGDGEYYILLMKQVAAVTVFGGYLTTDNIGSNSGLPEYAGWMTGQIDRDTFLDGDYIDLALAIFDPDGGQFATLTNAGELILDLNLDLWGSGFSETLGGGIEYNGVVDGLQDFVFPADSPDTLLFEHTVLVNPVPEPGVISLFLFGFLFFVRKIRAL